MSYIKPDGREEPNNITAEQQLLGALLADNDRIDDVRGYLKRDHFYETLHGDIYEKMLQWRDDDRLSSPVTLKPVFDQHPIMEQLGKDYIVKMLGMSISGRFCRDYASQIVDLAGKRSILEAFRSGTAMISEGKDTPEILKSIDQSLVGVDLVGKDASVSILTASMRAAESLNARLEGGTTGGVLTSRWRLDERLGSFYNQDLIILAGRPSMGKTALATSIALAAARRGEPVAFVSAEMGEESLVYRFWSEISGVPYFKMRNPKTLSEEDLIEIKNAARELADLPIEIVPDSVIDINAVRSACRRVQKAYGGLRLVIVDYLQMLDAEGRSPNERIGNISKGLKQMAKQLDAPVIALSQLSRKVEERDDKRPMLSDLRESGQIEQDADVVLFCYREHYYLSKNMPKKIDQRVDWEVDMNRCKNDMEVITAKQRMGSTGKDLIRCDVKCNKFWDIEEEPETQERYDF